MEHSTGSDYSTVYHGSDAADGDAVDPLLLHPAFPGGKEEVRSLLGGLPRLFALLRDEGGG
ncbi:hypothetical protein [Sphaerisporangium fuscum]|uniref:hypothetical protein n=1 Tax=Sphaerisporangium fuscum TaxID=2835868 RepID=UPI001BDC6DDC|nr:hypothetical protein [Sphaerisporangium fuscum]